MDEVTAHSCFRKNMVLADEQYRDPCINFAFKQTCNSIKYSFLKCVAYNILVVLILFCAV